jgi:hypothetical protein
MKGDRMSSVGLCSQARRVLAYTSVASAMLVVTATPALAGPPLRGGVYTGKTSQGENAAFLVSRSGTSFTEVQVNYRRNPTLCPPGFNVEGNIGDVRAVVRARISRRGGFSVTGTDTIPGEVNGSTTFTTIFRGRFSRNGRTVSGTAQSTLTSQDFGQGTTQTCSSGPLAFTARFRGLD